MRLYLPARTKHAVENFGFITPSTPEKNQLLVQSFAPIHTYCGIFEYHIFEDGSLSTLDAKHSIGIPCNI